MKPRSVLQYILFHFTIFSVREIGGKIEYENTQGMHVVDPARMNLHKLQPDFLISDWMAINGIPPIRFIERDGEIIAVVDSPAGRFESSLETWDIITPSISANTLEGLEKTVWRKI